MKRKAIAILLSLFTLGAWADTSVSDFGNTKTYTPNTAHGYVSSNAPALADDYTSTIAAPHWYQVKFNNGSWYLSDEGAGYNLKVWRRHGMDAQQWILIGNNTDGFKMMSKRGNYIGWNSTDSRFNTTTEANAVLLQLVANEDKYEIKVKGDANTMNMFGGAGVGQLIGKWTAGSPGNLLILEEAPQIATPTFSTLDAPVWYNVKFVTGGMAVAEIKGESKLKTATLYKFDTKQKWQLIGNVNDGFKMRNENGRYIGFASDRFIATTEANAVTMKMRVWNGGFELYRGDIGDGYTCMNPNGGNAVGKELAQWEYDKDNNRVIFEIAPAQVTINGWTYNCVSDGTNMTLTSVVSGSGECIIPETTTVDGVTYTITALGKDCFKNNTALTSISLPASLQSLTNEIDESLLTQTITSTYAGVSSGAGDESKAVKITTPVSLTNGENWTITGTLKWDGTSCNQWGSVLLTNNTSSPTSNSHANGFQIYLSSAGKVITKMNVTADQDKQTMDGTLTPNVDARLTVEHIANGATTITVTQNGTNIGSTSKTFDVSIIKELSSYIHTGIRLENLTFSGDAVDKLNFVPFAGCTNLTSITVAEGNTHFASVDGALYDASKTLMLRVPEGRTTTVKASDKLANIYTWALNSTTCLIGVTIPVYETVKAPLTLDRTSLMINMADDNAAALERLSGTTFPEVIVTHETAGASSWDAIMLPFDWTASGIKEASGITVNGNKVKLAFAAAGTLAAGKTYFIAPGQHVDEELVFADKTIVPTVQPQTLSSGTVSVTITDAYDARTAATGDYALDGTFFSHATGTVPADKPVLTVTGATPPYISIEGESEEAEILLLAEKIRDTYNALPADIRDNGFVGNYNAADHITQLEAAINSRDFDAMTTITEQIGEPNEFSNDKLYSIRNYSSKNYLYGYDSHPWSKGKANNDFTSNFSADIPNFLWSIYNDGEGNYIIYNVAEQKGLNSTNSATGRDNWNLNNTYSAYSDIYSVLTPLSEAAPYIWNIHDPQQINTTTGHADQHYLHENTTYNTGVTNWGKDNNSSKWYIKYVTDASNEVKTQRRHFLRVFEGIIVVASPAEGGTVSVSGQQSGDENGCTVANSNLTLTAAANTGYFFEGWYIGDYLVSASATATITPTSDNITYTARFVDAANTWQPVVASGRDTNAASQYLTSLRMDGTEVHAATSASASDDDPGSIVVGVVYEVAPGQNVTVSWTGQGLNYTFLSAYLDKDIDHDFGYTTDDFECLGTMGQHSVNNVMSATGDSFKFVAPAEWADKIGETTRLRLRFDGAYMTGRNATSVVPVSFSGTVHDFYPVKSDAPTNRLVYDVNIRIIAPTTGIQVLSADENLGTASVGDNNATLENNGTYTVAGATTLVATPKGGYKFHHWTAQEPDGEETVISYTATTFATPRTAGTVYRAYFGKWSEVAPSETAASHTWFLNSLKIKPQDCDGIDGEEQTIFSGITAKTATHVVVTTPTITVVRGQDIKISWTSTNLGYSKLTAYIDANSDGNFDASSMNSPELLGIAGRQNGASATPTWNQDHMQTVTDGVITIPEAVDIGETCLRLRFDLSKMAYDANLQTEFGQVPGILEFSSAGEGSFPTNAFLPDVPTQGIVYDIPIRVEANLKLSQTDKANTSKIIHAILNQEYYHNCIITDRNISHDKWNTLTLPFDMDGTEWDTYFSDVRELSSIASSGEDITLNFTSLSHDANMEKGKPYLVKGKAEASPEIKVAKRDLTSLLSPVEVEGGGYKARMTGNYNAITINRSEYFIRDNKFYYADADVNVKGFRAYIVLTTSDGKQIRVRQMNIGEMIESGVANVNIEADTNDVVYDLMGNRMTAPLDRLPQGVYIVNGRKVINQ